MPAFTPVWLDPADVRHWLRTNGVGSDDEQAEVDRVCAQAEIYVERCRPDQFDPDPVDPDSPPVFTADAEVYQGAVMYAARLLRRRNSPAGVESFGDVGIMFVTKYDADIERALRTGNATVPGAG